MSGKRFFSAASESQAVVDAAAELGIPATELAYTVRLGALRPGRVVIVVDLAAPRRAAGPAAGAEEPRPERLARLGGSGSGGAQRPEPREAVERGRSAPRLPGHSPAGGGALDLPAEPLPATGAEGARRASAAVAALAGLDLRAEVHESESGLRVELSGPGRPALVARGGELLRAAEYLLRRMVRELPEDGLVLDSEGFRAEREEALRRTALAASQEVRRTGASVLLEPLAAAERRIVHLAIAEEPGVASASEGEGDTKRVRILPAP